MPSSQQLHPGVHCLCHLGWGDYNGLQSPKPAKEREGIPCWSPAPREVSVETVAGSPGTAPISEASAADPPSAAGAWGPPTPSSFPGNCPCAQMRKGDSWSRWGAPCCREVQLGVGGAAEAGPAHVEWRAQTEHAKGPRTVALLHPLERRAPRCVFGSAVNKTGLRPLWPVSQPLGLWWWGLTGVPERVRSHHASSAFSRGLRSDSLPCCR